MSNLFQLRTKIIFGNGCRSEIGKCIQELNAHKVIVFIDPGVEKSGTADSVYKSLDESKISYEVFRDVREEPLTKDVMKAVEWARTVKPDVIIGMGGGSAIDLAKAVAFISPNTGVVQEYMAGKVPENQNIPVIAIPTTAGTGTEVSIGSVVIDPEKNWKGGLASPYLAPHYALVDPETLLSLPNSVALSTGLDAFGHAIESYTSRGAFIITIPIALEAIRLVYTHLGPFIKGNNRAEHAPFLSASSTMAGMSFRNTNVSLPHALAHAIGGRFRIPHGILIGMATVPVLEFNCDCCEEKYSNLTRVLNIKSNSKDAFQQAILDWQNELGFKHRLTDFGVKMEDLPILAHESMKVTRAIQSNPRDVSEADVLELLKKMM